MLAVCFLELRRRRVTVTGRCSQSSFACCGAPRLGARGPGPLTASGRGVEGKMGPVGEVCVWGGALRRGLLYEANRSPRQWPTLPGQLRQAQATLGAVRPCPSLLYAPHHLAPCPCCARVGGPARRPAAPVPAKAYRADPFGADSVEAGAMRQWAPSLPRAAGEVGACGGQWEEERSRAARAAVAGQPRAELPPLADWPCFCWGAVSKFSRRGDVLD